MNKPNISLNKCVFSRVIFDDLEEKVYIKNKQVWGTRNIKKIKKFVLYKSDITV